MSIKSHLWRNMMVFDGRTALPEPMAVITRGDRIAGLCPMRELHREQLGDVVNAGEGGLLTPGLIDCHTHVVFAGNRADEFKQRLEGASYASIAAAGGGILSTVRATRAASEQELLDATLPRVRAMLADGVTTLEIKSGYGLTLTDELKMLRVARRIGETLPVRVVTTLLGAHALPPEFKGNPDGYVALVCEQMIPAAAAEGLADAVDVFCETIAFDTAQCARVFETAQRYGLAIKAHAEQLSNLGGATLAAEHGALSADHLEYLDETGVEAMARAGTVAVLLPGAFYTLRETRLPPIHTLRRLGVPMAVASDANPGSSPIFQPTLTLNMACTLFQLTPTESLEGMTVHAAKALGHDELGQLHVGAVADFCVWDAEHPTELAYAVQPGRLRQRVYGGRITHSNPSFKDIGSTA